MRSGMTDLVSSFRQYVAESGTVIFTDNDIESLLDNNRIQIVGQPLSYNPYLVSGTTTYTNAYVNHKFLEGTASGTALVRVATNLGTIVTNYQSDFTNGQFTFDVNTKGTAYYYYGRSYNFYKAVSDGWFRKAGYYAGNFDFRVEGRQFNKSQVYQNCLQMKDYFSSLADPTFGVIERSDYLGNTFEQFGFGLHEGNRIRSYGEYSNQV